MFLKEIYRDYLTKVLNDFLKNYLLFCSFLLPTFKDPYFTLECIFRADREKGPSFRCLFSLFLSFAVRLSLWSAQS